MIRAPLGDQVYWDESVKFEDYAISHMIEVLEKSPANPSYDPQYRFELAKENWHCLLARYSRGDAISDLSAYFRPMLDAWEESERSGQSVWTEQQQYTRRAWAVNLDHYIVCFWLVGLALALEIPDDQWQRLLALIDNEGEDELLDRVIASRSPGRKIGTKLCHPKPYQRLLDAVNAPKPEQAKPLLTFVRKWYVELDRPAKPGEAPAAAMYERPYWYILGNKKLDDSGYFGRWCVEAVAAVKAFGIDDSLCLGHEHYPGDLLRPDGPSTHKPREEVRTPIPEAPASRDKTSLFARLFGKK